MVKRVTARRIRELLTYHTDDGFFYWNIHRGRRSAGQKAGHIPHTGYVVIRIDGQDYAAHRLVFLYLLGRLPAHDVDHINGTRDDNRFINLREVTRTVNMQNLRHAYKNSKSGLLGAHASPSGRWRATISDDGERVNLGMFDTALAAHLAYVDAKRLLHVGCTL